MRLNYGYDGVGLDEKMLEIFSRIGVQLITASDAHKPEDVGKYIDEVKLRKMGFKV